jgi:hypothetical protein
MLDTSKVNKNSGIPIGDRPQNHFEIMGNNEQPWLPVEAIDFLYSKLNKKSIGFEYALIIKTIALGYKQGFTDCVGVGVIVTPVATKSTISQSTAGGTSHSK